MAVIFTAMLLITGCSNDSNEPLTSENSKFNSGTASSGAGETDNTASSRPESLSEPLEIPNGDAATLIEFIQNVTSLQPSTREEAMIMTQAVLGASNRIIDDKQATDSQRRLAVGKKIN
ncbi:MAG: hypothetical protein QGH11_01245, partial [Pirellulaceae bacterium]|nr:hypothetical protein [Pirellulaceae bacterium]